MQGGRHSSSAALVYTTAAYSLTVTPRASGAAVADRREAVPELEHPDVVDAVAGKTFRRASFRPRAHGPRLGHFCCKGQRRTRTCIDSLNIQCPAHLVTHVGNGARVRLIRHVQRLARVVFPGGCVDPVIEIAREILHAPARCGRISPRLADGLHRLTGPLELPDARTDGQPASLAGRSRL